MELEYEPSKIVTPEKINRNQEVAQLQNDTQRMNIEDEGGIAIQQTVSFQENPVMRKKWSKDDEKNNEDSQKERKIANFGSPSRIQGYKTPTKPGNQEKVESERKERKKKWQIEDNEEDEIFNIVQEKMPIDILVQICVANVIEEQNRLVFKRFNHYSYHYRPTPLWFKSC